MTLDQRKAPYAGCRAAAATALVVPAATLAHTWAGGHLPSVPALLALSALVLLASSLVLRGTLRPRLLLPILVVAQGALHSSFVAVEATGHGHHAAAAASPWTGRMLAAHAAVAVLTAVVWRLCERAAAVLVRAATLSATYLGGRRDPLRAPTSDHVPRQASCLDLTPLRGPPAPLRRT